MGVGAEVEAAEVGVEVEEEVEVDIIPQTTLEGIEDSGGIQSLLSVNFFSLSPFITLLIYTEPPSVPVL